MQIPQPDQTRWLQRLNNGAKEIRKCVTRLKDAGITLKNAERKSIIALKDGAKLIPKCVMRFKAAKIIPRNAKLESMKRAHKWCERNPAMCEKVKKCKDNPSECKHKIHKWCERNPELCDRIKENRQ